MPLIHLPSRYFLRIGAFPIKGGGEGVSYIPEVSQFGFSCCDKHHGRSNFLGQGFVSVYSCSLSGREERQGSQGRDPRQELEQKSWKSAACSGGSFTTGPGTCKSTVWNVHVAALPQASIYPKSLECLGGTSIPSPLPWSYLTPDSALEKALQTMTPPSEVLKTTPTGI